MWAPQPFSPGPVGGRGLGLSEALSTEKRVAEGAACLAAGPRGLRQAFAGDHWTVFGVGKARCFVSSDGNNRNLCFQRTERRELRGVVMGGDPAPGT